MIDWADLVVRAQAGDSAALDELMRRGEPWIRNLCRHKGYFLPGWTEADLAFLCEHYGVMSPITIGHYLRHYQYPDGERVWRVGKHRAGRTWDEYPLSH